MSFTKAVLVELGGRKPVLKQNGKKISGDSEYSDNFFKKFHYEGKQTN